MKKIIFLATAAILINTAFAQKTIRDANAEARNVKGFHAIEVSGGIDLYLSSGDEAVAVSASDREIRDRIKTEVENGVLKIYYDWKKGMSLKTFKNSMKAYVSYKTLEKLTASGGCDVNIEDAIKSEKFALSLSGGSDIKGRINGGSFVINVSGGSDADLSGAVIDLKIQASGGSDFSGNDLAAENCVIYASGGSDVEIMVNKEFYAEASGGSDVLWKGKATVKGSKASGAGKVSHRS